MKYYADYWNESVFSVEQNGNAICKYQDGSTGKIVERKFKRPNDEAWMWEENGVGDLIEPMTKDEFNSFGKTWVWNNQPNEAERLKHSWRNYIKKL